MRFACLALARWFFGRRVLSGNYPDGSTGNLPFIPAHIKKPFTAQRYYFTGCKLRKQEEFSEKPGFFSGFFAPIRLGSGLSGWLMQYSRVRGKNPAASSFLYFVENTNAASAGFCSGGRCVQNLNSAGFPVRTPPCALGNTPI